MTTQEDKSKDTEAVEGSGTESSPKTARKSAKPAAKAAAGGAKTRRATAAKPAKAKAAGGDAKGTEKASGKGRRGAPKEPQEVQARPLPRLLARFREEISPAMIKEFEYSTPMQVPRLSKIILNIGIGAEASQNAKVIDNAAGDLALISGQHPITNRARKSIAGFKLREGSPVGLTVTLRGRRMFEFFDRLVNSTLPRIRDFRGISREAFDGRGNYSLGIREQVIFPEIDYNSIDRIRGLQIAIVTTARTDREGFRLLELMGVPFARPDSEAAAA